LSVPTAALGLFLVIAGLALLLMNASVKSRTGVVASTIAIAGGYYVLACGH
jgi:hypothetical protein